MSAYQDPTYLSIDSHKRNAHTKGHDNNQNDPHARVDVRPVLEQHTDGRDLCRDTKPVAIDDVPPDGEPQGGINQKFSMSDETSCHRQKGGDFSQGKLDSADDEANGRVAED